MKPMKPVVNPIHFFDDKGHAWVSRDHLVAENERLRAENEKLRRILKAKVAQEREPATKPTQ